MFEITVVAIALSMDAFAVSLTIGVSKPKHIHKLAFLAALYFGFFHGLMPLFGYLGGIALLGWLSDVAHWIAFILLVAIGLKMIFEGIASNSYKCARSITYSHYSLILLAIATSIDALAAGFSLSLMTVNGILACVVIAIITFVFSYAGVIMGRSSSDWIGNKAEIVGGVILVVLGVKVLMQ